MTTSPRNISYINLTELQLDKGNPRLPSKFRKDNVEPETIVNWMLEDASIVELMLAIGQAGFFVGESLLVIPNEVQDGYIVVEGNRRLTSLLLLSDPSIANIHNKKIAAVIEETEERPTEIPCIVFNARSEIQKYLGFRHVTGIKSWGVLSKARYLSELRETLEEATFKKHCRELAKAIGSRSDHVRKLLVGFSIYEQIEDDGFFKIANLDETTFHFNYLADSLSRENIRDYINVKITEEDPVSDLNSKKLKILIKWFFEKNEHGKSRVLGDSKNLGMLNDVLGNEEALDYFNTGTGSLKDAHTLMSVSSDSYHRELELSLAALKRAQSIAHHIESHHSSDLNKLKEIFQLAKSMKVVVEQKSGGDWDED